MNLQGKKLLILGANPETAGLVRAANDMGVYTIVTDYDPNAYAKRYASLALNVDAVDLDALIDLAKEEHVDGVLVGVAENLLPTYQKLCTALNMPCYADLDTLELMSDKSKFKDVCKDYGVQVIDEYSIDEGCVNFEFPVVIKPVDGCSSKGISVCNSPDEYKAGIEKALSFSKSNNAIVEKYMTGEEVIPYYVFQDGEPILVAMCDRYTNKEQKGVAPLPTSYIYPSRYLNLYLSDTDAKVKRMFRGLGIKNGVMFLQSFVDKDGSIRICEPGYRLNGAQEHYLVNAATGIDAKELMINFALTGEMSDEDISIKADPYFHGEMGCKLSPLVRLDKIDKITGLDVIKQMPEVISINPSYDVGDTVTGLGTLKQIVCRFYIMTDTKEQLEYAIEKVQNKFQVEDEEGNSMFLQQFNPHIISSIY